MLKETPSSSLIPSEQSLLLLYLIAGRALEENKPSSHHYIQIKPAATEYLESPPEVSIRRRQVGLGMGVS